MSKDKKKILPIIAVALAGALSLAGIVLRTFLIFKDYNPETGYYTHSSNLPLAFAVFALVAAPILITVAIFFRKHLTAPQWSLGLSTLGSSALFALAVLVFVVSTLFDLPTITDPYLSTLSLFAVIFGVISVLYFGRAILGLETGRTGALPYFPVGIALFALLVAVMFYFDKTTAINNPPKNMHMVAFILLSLYALCETRYLLGRLKTGLAYVVVSLALFYTGAASLPNLLYSIASNRILAISTVYDFILFAAFLYLLSRLLGMLPYRIPAIHPMVMVIAEREAAAEIAENAASDGTVAAETESVATKTPAAEATASAPMNKEARRADKIAKKEQKKQERAERIAKFQELSDMKKVEREERKKAEKAARETALAEKRAAEAKKKKAEIEKKQAAEAALAEKKAAEAEKKASEIAEKKRLAAEKEAAKLERKAAEAAKKKAEEAANKALKEEKPKKAEKEPKAKADGDAGNSQKKPSATKKSNPKK